MDGVKSASLAECHMLALKTDGSLYGWGMQYYFKPTGFSDSTHIPPEKAIKLLDGVKQVQANTGTWAALKNDGTFWVYDFEKGLQQKMSGVSSFAADINGWTYFVIKNDGTLWGWGDNTYGQLGQGGATGIANGIRTKQDSPVKILDHVASAAIAGQTSYAITDSGELYGWGLNQDGILGFEGGTFNSKPEDMGFTYPCQGKPVKLMDGAIAVNDGFVLKSDGSLWAAARTGYYKFMDGVKIPTNAAATTSGTTTKPGTAAKPSTTTNPGTTATEKESPFTDVPKGSKYYYSVRSMLK